MSVFLLSAPVSAFVCACATARELHSRGDIDGAFENYARAEAMRPGYAEPLINMANIYKEDKKDVRYSPPSPARLRSRMLFVCKCT